MSLVTSEFGCPDTLATMSRDGSSKATKHRILRQLPCACFALRKGLDQGMKIHLSKKEDQNTVEDAY